MLRTMISDKLVVVLLIAVALATAGWADQPKVDAVSANAAAPHAIPPFSPESILSGILGGSKPATPPPASVPVQPVAAPAKATPDPECQRCVEACWKEYEECRMKVSAKYNALCVQKDLGERLLCEVERFKELALCFGVFEEDCLRRCPNIDEKCRQRYLDKLLVHWGGDGDRFLQSVNDCLRMTSKSPPATPDQIADCLLISFIKYLDDLEVDMVSVATSQRNRCCEK